MNYIPSFLNAWKHHLCVCVENVLLPTGHESSFSFIDSLVDTLLLPPTVSVHLFSCPPGMISQDVSQTQIHFVQAMKIHR